MNETINIPAWAFVFFGGVFTLMLSVVGFLIVGTLNRLNDTLKELTGVTGDHENRIGIIEDRMERA